MLRNVALGKREEFEAKDIWALEMDLELAWWIKDQPQVI